MHAFTNQWYIFSIVEANLNKNAELLLRWCRFLLWNILLQNRMGCALDVISVTGGFLIEIEDI